VRSTGGAVASGTLVTVVIPTCRKAESVARAVRSILATDYEPLEIVVVENRPPAPMTRAVLEQRFADERVRYVEEPRRGVSWARNTGLEQARGEIVAFTDDDVVVASDWIETALRAFERAPKVACVTGRILPLAVDTPPKQLFDQFAAFDKGSEPRVFSLAETRAVDPLFPYVVGQVGSGANIFIRREIAVALGGFDPVLGPGTPTRGGEDLDLFIRVTQKGLAIVYDPVVIVRHDHPGSLDQLREHAYSYGIGLTAMLAKQLIHGPNRGELIRSIPAGMRYGLDPNSRKNVAKTREYPKRLDVLERSGMCVGPAAYVLSLARSAASRRRLVRLG
jgi:GT2 family glycosyltransferase